MSREKSHILDTLLLEFICNFAQLIIGPLIAGCDRIMFLYDECTLIEIIIILFVMLHYNNHCYETFSVCQKNNY